MIVRVYKHSKCNWPYPPPNTTFVVPSQYLSSSKNDITIGCSHFIIYLIWPTPLSNLTTKNKVDTDVDIDDESQSVENPRKKTTVPLN